MTIIIEAGEIYRILGGFKRYLIVTDGEITIIRKYIYATTKKELEIIDHERRG
jgi:hypothetical protein